MGILFVVNPVAGKGKSKDMAETIKKICRDNNIEYEMVFTSKPKDATEIARNAAKNGIERIIAVGGDGTVNEVLNGIVGTSCALGIVPSGSGNDFIRTINQSKDMEKIIIDNCRGNIRAIDVGKCNGRYFVNIAGGGFDALVVEETERVKKYFSGSMAYLVAVLTAFLKFKSVKVKIRVDDIEMEGDMLLTAVANGRYYGGGMLPAPKADIYDGLFDVYFIRNVSKAKFLRLAPGFMKGTLEGVEEVCYLRGKKVEIEANCEFFVNIDGEVISRQKINFEIIPLGINIIVPE